MIRMFDSELLEPGEDLSGEVILLRMIVADQNIPMRQIHLPKTCDEECLHLAMHRY